MAVHKLSLVAQYDDLIRNTSVLTKGIEAGTSAAYIHPKSGSILTMVGHIYIVDLDDLYCSFAEFITFVKNQESSRQQYHAESERSGSLKRKLDDLEEENRALQTKLKHARCVDSENTQSSLLSIGSFTSGQSSSICFKVFVLSVIRWMIYRST